MDRRLKLDNELIKSLYTKDGLSADEIALKMNVCQQTIQKRLKEMDVSRNYSEACQNKLAKPGMIQKLVRSWQIKPNHAEIYIDNLLQKYCPDTFIYNGTLKRNIVIGNKIPDWVDSKGQKLIIEYNGCYFHCCEVCGYTHSLNDKSYLEIRKRDKDRLALFDSLGYKTLVLWGHDSEKEVKEKLLSFVGEVK